MTGEGRGSKRRACGRESGDDLCEKGNRVWRGGNLKKNYIPPSGITTSLPVSVIFIFLPLKTKNRKTTRFVEVMRVINMAKKPV